jgi:protocatechuate 3,4-dioxygenase beta subunit
MGLKSSVLSALLASVPLGLAHPHGHPETGTPFQHNAVPLKERSLDHCHAAFMEPEFLHRTVKRHATDFAELQTSAGLEARDPELVARQARDARTALATNHKSDKKVSYDMDPATLFSDAGACILQPGVDEGPLYVRGEHIRKDITEGQGGIKLRLNIQVVDVSNCKPVEGAYVDIWSSNATGQYVGVLGYPGMGIPGDTGILKGTAMRGVQPTDAGGLATFDGIVPGHYEGRATHIHTIVYLGATKNANNTITGGRASFIGQIYFDMSLLDTIRAIPPYTQNKMAVTRNGVDMLFNMGANGGDPIVRYAQVGSTLNDGLFAWIRFGINPSKNTALNPAAFRGPDGVAIMNPTGPIAKMTGGGGFGGGFPGFGRPGGKKRAEEAAQDEE